MSQRDNYLKMLGLGSEATNKDIDLKCQKLYLTFKADIDSGSQEKILRGENNMQKLKKICQELLPGFHQFTCQVPQEHDENNDTTGSIKNDKQNANTSAAQIRLSKFQKLLISKCDFDYTYYKNIITSKKRIIISAFATTIVLLCIYIIMYFTGNVYAVKNIPFHYDKSLTYGSALGSSDIFDNTSWSNKKIDNRNYVVFESDHDVDDFFKNVSSSLEIIDIGSMIKLYTINGDNEFWNKNLNKKFGFDNEPTLSSRQTDFTEHAVICTDDDKKILSQLRNSLKKLLFKAYINVASDKSINGINYFCRFEFKDGTHKEIKLNANEFSKVIGANIQLMAHNFIFGAYCKEKYAISKTSCDDIINYADYIAFAIEYRDFKHEK